MPAKNKIRGNNLERELVNQAQEQGLKSVRAYGSDGRALGEEPTVDIQIADKNFQVKRRKKLAKFLEIPPTCEGVIFKQDYKKPLILIPYSTYLDMLVELENCTSDT